MKKNNPTSCTAVLLRSFQKGAGIVKGDNDKLRLSYLRHGEDYPSYDPYQLFVAVYNYIPNIHQFSDIDAIKVNEWIVNTYQSKIKDCIFCNGYFHQFNCNKDSQYIYYFIDKDVLIEVDSLYDKATILFRTTDFALVEEILFGIHYLKVRKKQIVDCPQISLVIKYDGSLCCKKLTILKPKLNIDDNYNDDFKEVHNIIKNRLSKEYDKGIVLLHGKPGTGKTSYIRYLITSVKKEVIFLPPDLAIELSNPGLLKFLIDRPNCILVIEDAENIIVDREQRGYSPVSALLNLTDGLLSDCLNIQVVCTFNTDLSKIDSALLRKGRLIAKYEFKPLTTEKSQALSNKLGYDTVITSPMSLTDIYNQGDHDFSTQKQRRAIGFHASADDWDYVEKKQNVGNFFVTKTRTKE